MSWLNVNSDRLYQVLDEFIVTLTPTELLQAATLLPLLYSFLRSLLGKEFSLDPSLDESLLDLITELKKFLLQVLSDKTMPSYPAMQPTHTSLLQSLADLYLPKIPNCQ